MQKHKKINLNIDPINVVGKCIWWNCVFKKIANNYVKINDLKRKRII